MGVRGITPKEVALVIDAIDEQKMCGTAASFIRAHIRASVDFCWPL
jgi:hypothetical protein